MDTSNDSSELNPFKSLYAGIFISASLTLFLYLGISLACTYLLQVALALLSLIVISALIFWFNIKYEYMSDLMNVISSTVAFDFRFSHSQYVTSISKFLKRINPYIGALGTFSGLLLILWTIPALVITIFSPPGTSDTYIYSSVFLMSTGICTAYFFSNRDQFTIIKSMISFFAGMLIGTLGVIKILLISLT